MRRLRPAVRLRLPRGRASRRFAWPCDLGAIHAPAPPRRERAGWPSEPQVRHTLVTRLIELCTCETDCDESDRFSGGVGMSDWGRVIRRCRPDRPLG